MNADDYGRARAVRHALVRGRVNSRLDAMGYFPTAVWRIMADSGRGVYTHPNGAQRLDRSVGDMWRQLMLASASLRARTND